MHGATRSFHAWGNPERGEKSNDAKPRKPFIYLFYTNNGFCLGQPRAKDRLDATWFGEAKEEKPAKSCGRRLQHPWPGATQSPSLNNKPQSSQQYNTQPQHNVSSTGH